MHSGAVIYEVSLDIDADAATELDRWLERHVAAMLTLPGFLEARVFNADGDSESVGPPSVRRVVHYTVQSRADLDRYLREDADRMRADGQSTFGTRMIASRRILAAASSGHEPSGEGSHCRNCDLALKGQYCSNCGQRARIRMITVWELLRDLFGDVFELDSRLWRSLRPLLFKPGHLTLEYLEGRRVRYMPPFRMYLVLSVLFFLLISLFSENDGININGDEDGGPTLTATIGGGEAGADTGSSDEAGAQPDSSSEAAAGSGGNDSAEDSARPAATVAATPDTEPTPAADDPPAAGDDESASGTDEEEAEDCDLDVDVITTGLGWLDRRLTEQHLEEVCRQVRADKGANAIREFLRNIPTMMFFFLPLIALLMKVLYPLSKRYYVEHLLFFVHYHAFFFLAMVLLMSVGFIVDSLQAPESIATFATAILAVYIPVYLFLAMRRVYAQSRLVTTFKYLLLGVGYFICLVITFTLTVIITALTL